MTTDNKMINIIKRIEDAIPDLTHEVECDENKVVYAVLTAVLKMHRGELDSTINDEGEDYNVQADVNDLMQEIERQLNE